jgi:hypothetical protein
MKLIMIIIIGILLVSNLSNSQYNDMPLSFEISDEQFVGITSFEYDSYLNYLTLHCIFKKYAGTEFSNLKDIIYLKTKEKNKVFPAYCTPFFEMKDVTKSTNILEGLLIFKIDKNWDRKIYSDNNIDGFNLNKYNIKDSLDGPNYIENIFYKIKEEIKHKKNENVKKCFHDIRDELKENKYSNYLPIKFEVLGDTTYFLNDSPTLKEMKTALKFYTLSHRNGNRDNEFIDKFYNLLFYVGNYYYYKADDNENIIYYDSSRIYFNTINEILYGRDNYNETLYKEIYSLYRILTHEVDFTVLKYNELQNLIKRVEECENPTGMFKFTYKAKILLGNYYFYLNNIEDANIIYKTIIEKTKGKDEYLLINTIANKFFVQINKSKN